MCFEWIEKGVHNVTATQILERMAAYLGALTNQPIK
jgi:hypothetical protein